MKGQGILLRKLIVILFVLLMQGASVYPLWADTTVGDPGDYIIQVNNDGGLVGNFVVTDGDPLVSTTTVIDADAASTTIGSTAFIVTGATTLNSTLGVTGVSTLNGINNGGDGITNAGAISGVTTLTTSGATSLGSTLSVAGVSTLNGINNGGDGITNAGAVSGVTTLNVSGLSTLSGGITADNFTVADTTGNLTASGATNIIGTAGSSVNTIRGATNTITGVTTITSIGTANQMIVDGTSSRFVSADGFSSADVRNGAVTLVADDDTSLSSLSMTPTSANLLVNTDAGESHGIYIGQTSTVVSGGTDSTTLTLDDDGATFADEDTGAPVTVTGVADGVNNYDAVNMRQFNKLEDRVDDAYSGIASVAALAAIPSPVQGKDFSLGLGYGNFKSENAVAVGGKALVGKEKNTTLTAGVGFCGSTTTISAGVGWSF